MFRQLRRPPVLWVAASNQVIPVAMSDPIRLSLARATGRAAAGRSPSPSFNSVFPGPSFPSLPWPPERARVRTCWAPVEPTCPCTLQIISRGLHVSWPGWFGKYLELESKERRLLGKLPDAAPQLYA